MELIFLAGGGLLTVLALLYAVFTKIQTGKIVQKIEDMLEAALKNQFCETAFHEGRVSKIETMMQRFLMNGETSKKKLTEEEAHVKAFISDISHQTKTPITNIKLYTELLKEQKTLTERERALTEQIQVQAENLNFLIQALVKTSRLENGIVSLYPKTCSVKALAEKLYNQYLPAAQEKRILLKNTVCDDILAVFDEKWTMEAVGNIADNAVKYTPCGKMVSFRVKEYEMFVCLEICDTGQGITETEIPRLFERFYRSPEVSGVRGVGVGLYLAREIIARQGGYIKVASQKGKGSVFSVFLPKCG